jgi:hypothetical protein
MSLFTQPSESESENEEISVKAPIFHLDLKRNLLEDETVLWSGQPDTAIIFAPSDIFLVPFSLFWGGFALFWEFHAISLAVDVNTFEPTVLIFPFGGLLFSIMGLYLIFGRFFYKAWVKKNTLYVVTNLRVIVIEKTLNNRKNITAHFIYRLPYITMQESLNYSGSICFGNQNNVNSVFANTGWPLFSSSTLYFHDIPNVYSVYQLVNKIWQEKQGSLER